ncbi:MAG TPA: hypothetical protein VK829_15280 [Terriglobales bacterium]|jgi:hypothetical protein|nr:hypothetical protein [Terriglobales bacterium]
MYPLYSGILRYGRDNEVALRAAHLSHAAGTRHLWLLLGSGPWYQDDARGCWVVLDSWVLSGDLIARVQSYTDSPFRTEHIFGERFLSRDEVLAKAGALDWAIERRDELISLHEQTKTFLLTDAETP